MTRILLATVFTLAIACPAFAASDEEVRSLALSMQNSVVAHDVGTFDAGVTGDRLDLTGVMDASGSVALADDVNASMIGQLTSNIPTAVEEEAHLLDPVCVCGAHLGDIPDEGLLVGPPGSEESNDGGYTDGGQVLIEVGPSD